MSAALLPTLVLMLVIALPLVVWLIVAAMRESRLRDRPLTEDETRSTEASQLGAQALQGRLVQAQPVAQVAVQVAIVGANGLQRGA